MNNHIYNFKVRYEPDRNMMVIKCGTNPYQEEKCVHCAFIFPENPNHLASFIESALMEMFVYELNGKPNPILFCSDK